jgi:uncharacterized protein YecE (DUF72 family)
MIYIGTSGFQYDDWVGTYYPEDLPKKEWLTYYAKEFNTLEINFTYYRMPSAKSLFLMANKVPDRFLFTVKATQEMTHARERDPKLFNQFTQAITPLREANKFGCVLAQFPSSFHASEESRDYIKWFRGQMDELPIVIEFRNKDWLSKETYELLHAANLGFCSVDEPYFPRVAEVTADIAYVRFHGRNYQKWWKHEQAYERYDYTYRKEELEEWTPKIEEMDHAAERTFVFANNHYRAQGIDTARQMKLLLPQGENAKD